MKIAAGIVLFNPDKERLQSVLNSLLMQVGLIIIYDNVGNFAHFFNKDNEHILYMTQNTNMGIAYALNRIMEEAKKAGFEWVVTMDQDTLVPDDMLGEFTQCSIDDKTAIICPQVIDKRRPYMSIDDSEERFSVVDFCITSASCTNLKIWDDLGGFDESLFIDFVDNDYCKRLNIAGLNIIRCNRVIIDQQFGDIKLKSAKKVAFFMWLSSIFHNKNIAKLSYKKNVSPLRVYYVHRNLIYLNEKFKKYGGIGYGNFYCNSFWGFLFYFSLPSLVRAGNKIRVLKSIVKGLRDGVKMAVAYKQTKNK